MRNREDFFPDLFLAVNLKSLTLLYMVMQHHPRQICDGGGKIHKFLRDCQQETGEAARFDKFLMGAGVVLG